MIKGQKLTRQMTPPTANPAIASFKAQCRCCTPSYVQDADQNNYNQLEHPWWPSWPTPDLSRTLLLPIMRTHAFRAAFYHTLLSTAHMVQLLALIRPRVGPGYTVSPEQTTFKTYRSTGGDMYRRARAPDSCPQAELARPGKGKKLCSSGAQFSSTEGPCSAHLSGRLVGSSRKSTISERSSRTSRAFAATQTSYPKETVTISTMASASR